MMRAMMRAMGSERRKEERRPPKSLYVPL